MIYSPSEAVEEALRCLAGQMEGCTLSAVSVKDGVTHRPLIMK